MVKIVFPTKTVRHSGVIYPPNSPFTVRDEDVNYCLANGGLVVDEVAEDVTEVTEQPEDVEKPKKPRQTKKKAEEKSQ